VHANPYGKESEVTTAVDRLIASGVAINYTALTGIDIHASDLDSLMTLPDAEQHVATALVYGLIFGIHYPQESQQDIMREQEEARAIEPIARNAGLKLGRRRMMTGRDWNKWALKLVDIWQRRHGVSLALQEVDAVFKERSAAVDEQLGELPEAWDVKTCAFTQITSRSFRFRANVILSKGCPGAWWGLGRSHSLGFCVGVGWLYEDAAIDYVRGLVRVCKRSMRDGKSGRFGRVLALFTVPLPSSETVEQGYLASMWEGVEFGASKYGRAELAARAKQELQRTLGNP
jgi:hypothetical protein